MAQKFARLKYFAFSEATETCLPSICKLDINVATWSFCDTYDFA